MVIIYYFTVKVPKKEISWDFLFFIRKFINNSKVIIIFISLKLKLKKN